MPPPAEGFASRLFLGPALRTQPDRRLVTLVREGYETAFEEIVRRYARPLGRYAASIVGSRSEDVTQDAFSKALLALRRDDAEIELRPWLFRIVRNTALNDLRDSPPSPEMLAEAIAGGRNPVEELERREELTDLMKRLRALPEPQRAAIVMRELEGLGHEEIAAALGLSGGAARQAIYRARRALRDAAGMLVPLPVLQALLAGGGSGAAEAAVGAAGVGAASVGGAAGAGVALKATAATVLVAGAVGTGVAAQSHGEKDVAATRPVPTVPSASPRRDPPALVRRVDAAALSGAVANLERTGLGSSSGDSSRRRSGPPPHSRGPSDRRESSDSGPGRSSHGSPHGHGHGKQRRGEPSPDDHSRHGGGPDRRGKGGRSGSGHGGDPVGPQHHGEQGKSGHRGDGDELTTSTGSGHRGSSPDGSRGHGGDSGSEGTAEAVPPPSQEPTSDSSGDSTPHHGPERGGSEVETSIP
jgi:RNA polymerase sigma factor (sigma-70 family)